MRSITARFVVWNGAFLLGALLLIGFIHVGISRNALQRTVDKVLLERAHMIANGPLPIGPNGNPPGNPNIEGSGGPAGGPGGGLGGGPEGQNPPFQNDLHQGPNHRPMEPDPRLRPRVFGRDGRPLNPGEQAPWSHVMLAASLRGEERLETLQVEQGVYRVISTPAFREGRVDGVVQLGVDWAPFETSIQTQSRTLLLIIPLGLLISAILAILLSRLVLAPVKRLTDAAESIAADPNHREAIAVAQQDEIGRLSQAFNAMTGKLQDANQRLADSLDRQRRFASDAAHELRTPLASLSLAAENGLHEDASDEERLRALAVVDRGAKTMSRLTSLLLTLARLDHHAPNLPTEPVAVAPIVADVITELGLGQSNRVDTDFAQNASAICHSDALRQVIRNLVENALAHTGPEDRITIAFRGDTLSVQDNGPGIPAEHLPHLFERFYRVDPSRERKSGGFGLGLAIVQSLAESQGGSVRVESIVGQGTTFFVNFLKSSQSS